MIKLKVKLNEAKSINDEYLQDWSSIPRDIFDKIIALDPQTVMEGEEKTDAKGKVLRPGIGPNAKQLLLPKYRDGEKDFLEYGKDVTDAINTFINNRARYDIKAIAQYPSVRIFVNHIKDPTNNPVTAQETKQESKLDQIYNKYYNNIPRNEFNYIIELDSNTNIEKGSIGEYAKNLLLPLYQKGDKSILNPAKADNIRNAFKKFPETIKFLSDDHRELTKYTSIDDFIQLATTGEKSNQYTHVMETVPTHVKYIGSTIKYDVWEVLDTWGAAVVAGAEREFGGPGLISNGSIYQSLNFNSNAYGHWCTTTRTYWSDYRDEDEKYYDFIIKNNPAGNERRDNYQLAVNPNGGDRQTCTGEEVRCSQNEVFTKDAELLELCSNLPDDCYLSKIKEVIAYKIAKEVSNKPFIYTGEKSLNELKQKFPDNYTKVFSLIREIIIDNSVIQIPPVTFANWASVEKITFSNNLKMIGSQAFKNCINIGLIKFPESLEYIGVGAFSDCSKLHGNLIIPNNVRKIGRGAFDGTDVKLSILSDRTTPLDIRKEDVAWFGTNSKLLNVLKDSFDYHKDFEQELYEEIMDENIPKDLVAAYKTAEKAGGGGVGEISTNSSHKELQNAQTYNRRNIKWDYANSTYTPLSYEEAREYLGLDNVSVATIASRLPNLRLIINGKLAEWENHNGKIYYLYSTEIPWDRIRNNNSNGFRGKNEFTNDTKFAQKASDIDLCLKCADKIYQTDEYQHPLYNNDNVINSRKEKSSTYVTYDNHTGITDPESSTSKYKYINVSNKYGNYDTEYDWKNDPDDTYKNKFNVYYDSNLTRKGIAVRDTGSHDLDRAYDSSSNANNEYVRALKNKKQKHEAYTDTRLKLQQLEKNKDLYDEEEYENLYNEFVEEKNNKLKEYQQAYDEVIKQKKLTVDGWSIRLNKTKKLLYKYSISFALIKKQLDQKDQALRDITRKLEEFKRTNILDTTEYQNLLRTQKNLEQELVSYRNKVNQSQNNIQTYREEIKRYEDLIKSEEIKIEQNAKLAEEKIVEIEHAAENLEEGAAKIADGMAAQRREMENQIDELREFLNKYGYKKFDKRTVKEIDSELKKLIRIVNSEGNPVEDEASAEDASNTEDSEDEE